jgi:hypothetical protein
MTEANLIQTYRQLDAAIARADDALSGGGDHETDVFIPTAQHRADAEATLKSLADKLAALEAPDPVTVILKEHMADFLAGMNAHLQGRFARPGGNVAGFMWMYEDLSQLDSRPDSVRAAIVLAKLNQVPALFAAVRDLLPGAQALALLGAKEAARANVSAFAHYAGTVAEDFPGLTPAKQTDLQDALRQFADQCAALADHCDALLKTADIPLSTTEDSVIKMDPQAYADHLLNTHGVRLDELLAWHESEIEKTRAAVFAIAARLNIPEKCTTMKDVNAVLLKYAGPAPDPDEMIRRGKEYIVRTHAEAKHWVSLPEEDCVVVNVPEIIKISYPWGGYGGGCPRRRPLLCRMFLNRYN